MGVKDQTIDKFLEEVASKKPTPGGGAVAAVVGAMAAALVEMVINLTKDPTSLKLRGAEAKNLRKRLLNLADEDCRAFEAVLAAYKSKDNEKIKKALQKAIDVPEETEKLSQAVEKLAKEIARVGNENAYSDAKTAIHLAQAAAKSARANIKINEESLKNQLALVPV